MRSMIILAALALSACVSAPPQHADTSSGLTMGAPHAQAADCTPSHDGLQARCLGKKAVVHLYWYSPKTREITFVDSYLFKDLQACKDHERDSLGITAPTASAGDLVYAKCVELEVPEDIGKPERAKPGEEATTL